MNGFLATASNIWESIQKIFSGVVNFVAGVFSGDWERAWRGVCDIFSGISSIQHQAQFSRQTLTVESSCKMD